jgi:hypothetical protein
MLCVWVFLYVHFPALFLNILLDYPQSERVVFVFNFLTLMTALHRLFTI